MPNLVAIMNLGRIAHDSVASALDQPRKTMPFGHGAVHHLESGLRVYDSYHCSRYNTNTRVLTEAMLVVTLALRTGKKIEWDAKALQAYQCPEVEPLIRRPYRTGW